MRHYLFVILFTLGMVTLGCKGQQAAVSSSKVELSEFGMPILLEYTPKEIHLGKIKRGDRRKLEFEYKNISDEVVEIELVSACSCTETDFTVSVLQPGDTGKILLKFDSTSKEKSETIDVDVYLKNVAPDTGYPIVDRVRFDYEF